MRSLIKKTGIKIFRMTSKALLIALLALSGLYCVPGVEASGSRTLDSLPIGAKVVDPSWQWEHKTGSDYSGSGVTKPVTWIVVAKDHYASGTVTLLADELIGRYTFDNSTNRGDGWGTLQGSNHWGDSGTPDANRGLRPWLNSTGIHSGDGFYQAFSAAFQAAVVPVTLPNKHWELGDPYNTLDRVFIPSTTELGDTEHNITYPIGTVYSHFSGATDADRIARLGETPENWWNYYWTRSPVTYDCSEVRYVKDTGAFSEESEVLGNLYGVRPALNLQSGVLVSVIKNADGAYEILPPRPAIETFGFYDHLAGRVYVKYDHTPGPADATYRLGPRGNNWLVFKGDWNGDGTDTFGFYDRREGRVYVKYDHTPGPADATYRLGPRGNDWEVLVGDFNGDGKDTFGFYDRREGRVYVKYNHQPGSADRTYRLGPRGNNWEVLVGSWR